MGACEKCWAEAQRQAIPAQKSVMDVYVGLVHANWCGAAHRDLTPAAATHDTPYGASEARTEVEAFMGEGWNYSEWWADSEDVCMQVSVGDGVSVFGHGPTYRAAVDALKAAWRDAVAAYMDHVVIGKDGF